MDRIIRDRHLTPEEAAKYNAIRDKVAEELPELIARHEARTAEYAARITAITAKLQAQITRLSAEKEDLRLRNQLLRTRLDSFSPERIQPRLEILTRLDALQAENEKLRGIIAQHDLCHDLHGTVDAPAFAAGCAAEQRRIYNCAPDADELARVRTEIAALLDACGPLAIRYCEGGGPEDLLGSLALTVIALRDKVRGASHDAQIKKGD